MLSSRRVLLPREIALPAPATLASAARVVSLGGETMGTTWSVKFVPSPHVDMAELRSAVGAVLAGIVREMSPWQADADITRFNEAAADSWHALPADFWTVLQCAIEIARQTDGAYDPTIAPLVDLWGFGPAGRRATVPAKEEIAAAQARCGWRQLDFDQAGQRVRQPGGLCLDLSSIAKGFAVDRLSEVLAERGIAHHLVEIGGELRGCGMKPDGMPWWVALEAPPDATGLRAFPETVVALHGLSIATSGDGVRSFDVDGRRFSHTLDPRSGHPVRGDLASVTVLHRQCMFADVWATALTVLDLDDGFRLACEQDLAARFVLRAHNGYVERTTPTLSAMLD